MRYFLSKDFTQIAETSGTIQNTSHIYSAEISDSASAGSGLILPPLNKISFVNKTLYARCVDVAVEIRVVPFLLTSSAGASSASTVAAFDDFTQDDIDDIFKP